MLLSSVIEDQRELHKLQKKKAQITYGRIFTYFADALSVFLHLWQMSEVVQKNRCYDCKL